MENGEKVYTFGEKFKGNGGDLLERLQDVIITVVGVEFKEGKYGEQVWVFYTVDDGPDNYFVTGAKVIVEKMRAVKENNWLPIRGKVIKKDKYWNII